MSVLESHEICYANILVYAVLLTTIGFPFGLLSLSFNVNILHVEAFEFIGVQINELSAQSCSEEQKKQRDGYDGGERGEEVRIEQNADAVRWNGQSVDELR